MQLTPAAIANVAGRAWFYFLVYDYYNLYLNAFLGDATVITGEGVNTLDQVRNYLLRPFPSRFQVQLDVGGIQAEMREVDVEDLAAIRAAYVALWGEVDKPNVYRPPFAAAGC